MAAFLASRHPSARPPAAEASADPTPRGLWAAGQPPGQPGPRGDLETSAPATRAEGMPTGAFECGVVWKVNGQTTMGNRKCTAAQKGAVVTFELQVGSSRLVFCRSASAG